MDHLGPTLATPLISRHTNRPARDGTTRAWRHSGCPPAPRPSPIRPIGCELPGRVAPSSVELSDLFLHEYVLGTMNGIPLELVSDRDKIFTSDHFDHLAKRLGISLRLSSARSQQTNGKAERKIAAIEEVLRNGVNYRQDNWTEILPYALFALNQAPSAALDNKSSLYYERGFNPITPVDIVTSFITF